MKKSILIAAAALLLGTLGASFAQTVMATSNAVDATKSVGASASVDHLVLIHVPNVMMLRIQGNGGTDVTFNPTVTEAGAFSGGVATLTPDTTTANKSTFSEVDAFTNMSSGGPKVTVGVAKTTGFTNPTTGLASAVQLGGSTANGQSVTLATNGWTQLWVLNDFTFALPDTAVAGDYSYTVTYTISNP